ncbi:CDP-diacylglycerol--serine O-phosphatidyltransferase [Labilibaculum euxinus]|uniref:CDP-diacylglycerol--serine O-phosphatidyltransferase n=1 Tax=Labilibaculum euxinus TaxID=2686357 RepID=A0A7M4D1G1_9BACT|nr:CDP-diacylglycerol--serine O-phosphatidyltransferase [Labilibaculum euxinus]MUP36490.1 CDP-diacylglycerol--serine O-phosphatidyltransferase [Labilibaculum euxinus]MVB05695.1 CDP-diacylglycerol--serine O-phosphatidyltransferase [Labilibaculum euxinus]
MSEAKGIIKHIPNSITCLNLLSGCTASLMAMEGYLVNAAFLILLAAVFDFFDGLAARVLKAYSPMGKELDSLADMVSFGFAPGVIALAYLKNAVLGSPSADFVPAELSYSQIALLLSAFIIPIFSALRLAKFNIDTRQTSSFIGVPTPANAMFWASLPLVLHYGNYPQIEISLANPILLIATILITSYLLVTEIPMFALKVKSLAWKENKIRYLFLITLLVLAILLKWLVIPMILFVYIGFSLLDNILNKK